jgi:hypothetical protein
MTPKCLAALAVVSLFVSAAAAIEVDFDQPTDLTSFSFEAQYSHTPFVWNASAGVGGGGGLTVTGSHAATYMPDAYDFRTPGAALNASAMFRAKDPGVIQPGSSVTYGNVYVVREPNEHGTFFADSLESSVRESADEIELAGGDFGVGGQGSGWSVPFPKGLVQPGRWYQIAAEIRNVGTGLFDWTVQLNDYGPTGQQLVGLVAEARREWDVFFTLAGDSTLYGGFQALSQTASAVDNYAASLTMQPIATTTLTIQPTFDVESRPGTTTTTLIEGDAGIRLGSNGTAVNSEAIMEFPLDGLPEGARVIGARLVISPNVTVGEPQLRVRAYEGDGLASIGDATEFANQVNATFTYTGTPTLDMPLNAVNMSHLFDGSHLGLRVSNATPTNSMFINAKEAVFFPEPSLVLEYYVPPGPGDFQGDGDVDGADLALWRSAIGVSYRGDANGDGDSDGADFLIWQRNLGAAGVSGATQTVPEPASWAFAALVSACWPRRGRNLSFGETRLP